MFCKKCGAEIADNSVFCEYCGAKVEEMPVDTGHADEGHDDSDTEEQRSKKEKNKDRKKGRRIGIIVGVVLVLACVGVGLTFMLRKGDAHSDGIIGDLPKAKTPQEQALNNYFSAIKNFDMGALAEACYPKEAIDEDRTNYFLILGRANYYVSDGIHGFDFCRGPVDIYREIIWRTNDDRLKVVYESYPEASYSYYANKAMREDDYEQMNEFYEKKVEYNKQFSEENDSAKRLLSDFDVTYSLLSMDKLSDCTIKDQGKEVDVAGWINSNIENVNVSAEDVYVARIQVEWAYGDKLYGWDKNWWNDTDFGKWVVEQNITPESTYESIIDSYKNQEYVFFIYPQNDSWYVYQLGMLLAKMHQVEYN